MAKEARPPSLSSATVNGPTVGTSSSLPSYTREDLLAAVKGLAPRLGAASAEIESGRSLTEPLVQALVDGQLGPRARQALPH